MQFGAHSCELVTCSRVIYRTDTHKHAGFPGLRSDICAMVSPTPPTPPRPDPSHLAPCLHLTHPVFNPVPPTAHSLNASAAGGDRKRDAELRFHISAASAV